jgi:hypothetical protein
VNTSTAEPDETRILAEIAGTILVHRVGIAPGAWCIEVGENLLWIREGYVELTDEQQALVTRIRDERTAATPDA